MAIKTPAWNLVRETLRALNDLADDEVAFDTQRINDTKLAFAEIERDVEQLIHELEGSRKSEHELRTALEEPTQSEFQRR